MEVNLSVQKLVQDWDFYPKKILKCMVIMLEELVHLHALADYAAYR